MKTLILVAAIVSIALIQNPCAAQSQDKSLTDRPPSAAIVSPPGVVAQVPASHIRQSNSASNAATMPSGALTISPTEVGSLTAKEILAANNQAVTHVASMYQYFGLFITIIVTVTGVLITILAFFAQRSVKEFIQEWDKKLQLVERNVKDSQERLKEAVEEAEKSANRAATHEKEVKDTLTIVTKVLEDLDRIRAEHTASQAGSGPCAEPPAPPTDEAQKKVPSGEPSTAEEDAEVASRLEGKVKPREDGEA